jgi:outer membrane biosynthesis protein TonB
LRFGKNITREIVHVQLSKNEAFKSIFSVLSNYPQTLMENFMVSRFARLSLAALVSAAIGLSPLSVMAADPAPAPAPAVAPTVAPAPAPVEQTVEKKAKKSKKDKKAEKKAKKKSKKKAKSSAQPAAPAPAAAPAAQ